MEAVKNIVNVSWTLRLNRVMDRINAIAPVPGRLLLSAIFIWSGLGKITGWENAAGFMTSKGMPMVPFFLLMAILLELGGGLSLLLGAKARWGALALVGFLIPTTLIFHNFWAVPAEQHFLQIIMFMKNSAIIGGLLMVAAFGAGGFSMDQWLTRRNKNKLK